MTTLFRADGTDGAALAQPAFGHRLRQLRRERNLSQAELAGRDFSASYVSLLESGQRNPTHEVVERFAERLGVPVEQLLGGTAPADRPGYLAEFLNAATAREDGEYEVAAGLLRELAERAEAAGDHEDAWSARWELSEILHHQERTGERLAVLRDLVERPLTRATAELDVRVRTALAETLRYLGRVGESVRIAQQAVQAGTELEPTAPERIRALLELIAALTEAGDMAAATQAETEVLAVLDQVASRQLRGSAYWSIGNVRMVTGRIEEGIAAHDAAFGLLRPETDLRLWARLSKASAAMRLADGGSRIPANVAAARDLLTRADSALDLVGTPADRTELLVVETQLRLAEGDHAGALESGRRAVEGAQDLSAQDLASCLLAMARAQVGLDRLTEAAATFRTAAGTLEEAGAFKSANAVWRELSELLLAHPGTAAP